jgi:hypothetical protein
MLGDRNWGGKAVKNSNSDAAIDIIVEILGYRLDNSGADERKGDLIAVRAIPREPGAFNNNAMFLVKMTGSEDDNVKSLGNPSIRDLLLGTELLGVRKCGVGSVIELQSCRMIEDGVWAVDSYSVLEAFQAADLSEMPDPTEKFEGNWKRPTIKPQNIEVEPESPSMF